MSNTENKQIDEGADLEGDLPILSFDEIAAANTQFRQFRESLGEITTKDEALDVIQHMYLGLQAANDDLFAITEAVMEVYCAGDWSLSNGISKGKQQEMWTKLRDVAGITPGTSSGLIIPTTELVGNA